MKLSVALSIVTWTEPLAIPVQRIALLFQQARHGGMANLKFLSQFAGQYGQTFVRPFQTADGIACGGVFQQLVQCRYNAGLFFSTARRPAPALRMGGLP